MTKCACMCIMRGVHCNLLYVGICYIGVLASVLYAIYALELF